MGLAAVARRGWMTNPRKQGAWNLKVLIIVSIIVPLIGHLIKNEDMFGAVYVTPLFLLWGITWIMAREKEKN